MWVLPTTTTALNIFLVQFSEVSQFEKGFKSLEHFFLALCSNTKLFPINKDV